MECLERARHLHLGPDEGLLASHTDARSKAKNRFQQCQQPLAVLCSPLRPLQSTSDLPAPDGHHPKATLPVCLDDVVIHSSTWSAHLYYLREDLGSLWKPLEGQVDGQHEEMLPGADIGSIPSAHIKETDLTKNGQPDRCSGQRKWNGRSRPSSRPSLACLSSETLTSPYPSPSTHKHPRQDWGLSYPRPLVKSTRSSTSAES